LKASVPHFRHLSEGVPEGKEIVMHGGGGLAPLAQQPPAAEPLIPVRRKRSKMLGNFPCGSGKKYKTCCGSKLW